MTRRKQRRFSPEQVTIVRRYLLEQVPVSGLCDEYDIQPTVFYRWQKQLFEKDALLQSVPGVYAVTSHSLIACLPELGILDRE